ncbi:MAG: ferritin-like domain-containing protein [Campylobacter sp.]|nr:ferritin-like domain-containing protein [Campylobacter sp.]
MHNEFLNAVYISEKNAQALYESISRFDKIFDEIKTVRSNALELIRKYAQVKNLELDRTDTPNAFLTPNNLEDAIICALNYEIQLNKMYDNFTLNLDDEELKDLFFRLWATSHNEYISTLKQNLAVCLGKKTQPKDINLENLSKNFTQGGYENILSQYQKSFNEISDGLQNIASGNADKAQLAKILNNPNFSFFSGLALGALGISIIEKTSQKDKTDE